MLKISIVSQDEKPYSPRAEEHVIQAMLGEVTCLLPRAPMPTPGGRCKGRKRHLSVGAIGIDLRVVGASLRRLPGLDGGLGTGISMEHIARAHGGIPCPGAEAGRNEDGFCEFPISTSCIGGHRVTYIGGAFEGVIPDEDDYHMK